MNRQGPEVLRLCFAVYQAAKSAPRRPTDHHRTVTRRAGASGRPRHDEDPGDAEASWTRPTSDASSYGARRPRGRARLPDRRRPARADPHGRARGVGRTGPRGPAGQRRAGPARAEGLTVVPWCPFARRWLRQHPDEAAGLVIDWEAPRPGPLSGWPPGRAGEGRRPASSSRTRTSPSQSSTVTVRPGWRSRPVGSSPRTGSRKRTQTPRRPLEAKVTPPSARDSRAGPPSCGTGRTTTSVGATLSHGVATRHGPNGRAARRRPRSLAPSPA